MSLESQADSNSVSPVYLSLNRFNHSMAAPLLARSALIAVLAASASVNCYGFTEFARGAVTLETEGRLTYDSYFIGARNPGDDDYYASLRPQLKYVRKAGLAQIDAYAAVDVIRYNTNTEFDSEDFSAGFHTELPVNEGSRISGDINVNYNESTTIDYSVMDRIPTKSLTGTLSLRYKLGLKTDLADSFSYARSNRTSYSDQETYSNDLSFGYSDFLHGTSLRLTHGYVSTTSSGNNIFGAELDQSSNSLSATLSRPIVGKLVGDVTYGYRVLDRSAKENTAGQTQIEGSFFSLNLRGPFLSERRFSKLQSSASLSYQESRSPGINDLGQKTLTGDIRLSWAARERTKVSLWANRSVDLAANDFSVEVTQANMSVTEEIGYATHVTGQLGYTWRSFRGVERRDETLDASLSAVRTLSRTWTTGVSYTYQDNSSNIDTVAPSGPFRSPVFDYQRHVISVFVSNVF